MNTSDKIDCEESNKNKRIPFLEILTITALISQTFLLLQQNRIQTLQAEISSKQLEISQTLKEQNEVEKITASFVKISIAFKKINECIDKISNDDPEKISKFKICSNTDELVVAKHHAELLPKDIRDRIFSAVERVEKEMDLYSK